MFVYAPDFKKWKWAATTQSVRNKKAGVRHEKPKARHKA
jgi:hypothetical protein